MLHIEATNRPPGTEGELACRRVMFTAPHQVEVITQRLPPLGPGEVYAHTVVSGISHGTEMAWLRGQAAALHRAWDPVRRIYLDRPGRDFPVMPGYETVARIARVGPEVTGLRVGDLVYLDRPHADVHVIDAATARDGLVPTGIPAEHAVFWPLARVALGGVHDADICIGDTVVVVGLGTVGLLTVQLARMAGAGKVIGVDQHPLRLQAGETLGAIVINSAEVDVADQVHQLACDGADVAIEASGSYGGLHQATRCCRLGGRVTTVASYHGDQPGLRLGEEYHRNRITLISSMTVNGCPHRHPTWSLERLNRTARDLVCTGRLLVDGLITHRVPFTLAADAYALIKDQPQNTIKVVFTYDD